MRRVGTGGRRRRLLVAATVVLASLAALTAVSCSSDGDDGSTSTSVDGADGATSTTVAAGEPEAFEGTLDAFYDVPDPLPAGEPGDVIRTMAVEGPGGEAGLRIMYLSSDAEDDVRVGTGVVYAPDGEAPSEGWPIVAWAHGTSGLAAECAPSRADAPSSPGFGVEGIRFAADYLGLGPNGELHPYLSKAAEANAIVDGVAAVRSLDLGAGDRWVVVGVSQGGHAALATGEVAAERLPDAELLGVVALAPGAELGRTYGDQIQIRIITTMVLFGVAAEDPTVDPADYLNPDALAAAEVIESGCVNDVIEGLPGLAAADDYFTVDPRTSPTGEAWIAENDPGQVASEAPLLLIQGGADILVVPARTDALQARLCSVDQVVERLDIPTADHNTVTPEATDEIEAWLDARFAGAEAVDDC